MCVYKGPRVRDMGADCNIQTFSVGDGATRNPLGGRQVLSEDAMVSGACGAGELHSMRKLLRAKPAGQPAAAAVVATAAMHSVVHKAF